MRNKILITFAIFSGALYADNPLITTMYTADPTARVVGDKLFVFPSSDVEKVEGKGNNGFMMPYYHVFSTENLLDWTDYGKQIDQNDVPWGEKDSYAMWAPDCIEKDGKFYYYFPAQPKGSEKRHFVGVGVADKAEGPYRLEKEPIKGVAGIDPNVFVDDDGQAYIYWGSGDSLLGCRLKENMRELEGEPIKMKGTPPMYKEAAFMFKREGKYYFTYSHLTPFRTCELSYSVGDTPLGDFEYKGAFMERWPWCWTNHHSFVEYKGEWILFYHHNEISNNSRMRSIRADYVSFDKNGNIEKVTPTNRGIGVCDAGREIQVDRYSEIAPELTKVVRIDNNLPARWMVTQCADKGWISYNNVDFAEGDYNKVVVRCASSKAGKKKIEIRKNGFWGDVIAEVDVPNTGGDKQFKDVIVDLKHCPKGVQNLYLMFSTPDEKTTFGVDWIKFIKS